MKKMFFQGTSILVFSLLLFDVLNAQIKGTDDLGELQRHIQELSKEKDKNRGEIKLLKRQLWHQQSRIGLHGKFMNIDSFRQVAVNRLSMEMKTGISLPESTSGGWSLTGPTSTISNNGIGRVNRIVFHPTNSNILFAATADGGLWKTNNAANSWFPLTDGIPNLSLTGIAINPGNPSTIYILTGDADGYNGTFTTRSINGWNKPCTGVLKTTDGGTTWRYTGLSFPITDEKDAFRILIHPTNPDILFVCAGLRIYRTLDAGDTWSSVYFGTIMYDMEFKPGNPNFIYASGDRIILRSTNGGSSFDTVYTLPDIPANSAFTSKRTCLAVTPDNPSYVYILAAPTTNIASSTFRGIYLSTNSGDNFTVKSTSPSVLVDGPGGDKDQSSFDMALAAHPGESGTLVSAGTNVYRSVNSGQTNTHIVPGYHGDIHDLAFNPLDNKLYMACDGGIYVSTDEGLSWNMKSDNLAITQYYKFDNHPAQTNFIVAGAQDNGTHLRTAASSIFDRVWIKDGTDCVMHPSNTNIFYAGFQDGWFFKTTDGGNNFDTILVGTSTDLWVSPIAMDPNDPPTLYTLQNVLKKTTNSGNSFTNLPLSFGNDKALGADIDICKDNSNVVYVYMYFNETSSGDYKSRLFRSGNGGTSWSQKYEETDEIISDIVVNPDDSSEVWITFGGFDAGHKVLHSNDNGNNWTNVSGTLPNIPVNCIAFADNNGNPADAIYIGTDIGVFYRDNDLDDWVVFSNGLPVVEITDIEVVKNASLLRVSTFGRGIWESPLFTPCTGTIVLDDSNQELNRPYYHQVSFLITSTADVKGAGAHVFYQSGEYILLQPGFSASANTGAKFKAFLKPCAGGVPPEYKTGTFNNMKGYLEE